MAHGKRICGAENLVKDCKRSYDLEMMGGASAPGGFLVELPCPVDGKAAAQAMAFNQVRP